MLVVRGLPRLYLALSFTRMLGLFQAVGAGRRQQLRQRLHADQWLAVEALHVAKSHPLEAGGQAHKRDLGMQSPGHPSRQPAVGLLDQLLVRDHGAQLRFVFLEIGVELLEHRIEVGGLRRRDHPDQQHADELHGA